jgi:hypothetical protein
LAVVSVASIVAIGCARRSDTPEEGARSSFVQKLKFKITQMGGTAPTSKSERDWSPETDNSNESIGEILTADLSPSDHSLNLTGWRVKDGEVSSLSLFVEGVTSPGVYSLNHGKPGRATFSVRSNNSNLFFPTDSINSGEITITGLDTVSRVISGNFWFSSKGKFNEARVSGGEFAVRYRQDL